MAARKRRSIGCESRSLLGRSRPKSSVSRKTVVWTRRFQRFSYPEARESFAVSLKEYARKRSFTQTPEPKPDTPKAAAADGNFFCVQRHHATRLHHDFRLEVGGT